MSAASDFINKVKEGAYDSKTNAQRAIGVWSRHNKWGSEAEVDKAKKFVDGFNFGTPSKAPATTKKAAAKKAPKAKAAAKGTAKKAAKQPRQKSAEAQEGAAGAAPTPGALPMSPATVESVGDILRLVDSTVASGVKTLTALKQVQEISPTIDISTGIDAVKRALEGAASVLNLQVVAPLSAVHTPTPQDAVVAERLQKVVNATNEMNSSVAQMPPTSYLPPPPPPAPPALQ